MNWLSFIESRGEKKHETSGRRIENNRMRSRRRENNRNEEEEEKEEGKQ